MPPEGSRDAHGVWERRRRRCLHQDEIPAEHRDRLAPPALAILAEVRRLAEVEDPAAHAAAPVGELVERVNALDLEAAVLLHGPVCNGVAMLRDAALRLLQATSGTPAARSAAGARSRSAPRPAWLLVVGDDEVLAALVEDCAARLAKSPPVQAVGGAELAGAWLAARRDRGLVVANLSLAGPSGFGPHGLEIAAQARRRGHGALLVTAARDYLDYRRRLAGAGLTGHDVVIKTERDFAERLCGRLAEIAEPSAVPISIDLETGHAVRLADVEVLTLEAQEALLLRFLDGRWRTAADLSAACADESGLAPSPGNVAPLISALRRKLGRALLEAESPHSQRSVIESLRPSGERVRYRLAPWLRWEDAPPPAGAGRQAPPVLIVEDDAEWAVELAGNLAGQGWRGSVAPGAEAARRALSAGEPAIVVADLALPDLRAGLDLVRDLAGGRPDCRVIVLSAYGGRDGVLEELWRAGVRAVDVINKAAAPEERLALLLGSLDRAVGELRRGVRRPPEAASGHRLVRLTRHQVEVDGHPLDRLTEQESAILAELIRHENLPVAAEVLEARCFRPRRRPGASDPLNKVHSAIRRLRRRIDAGAGPGVGAAVIRTPRMGRLSAYRLRATVTDLVGSGDPLEG